MQMKTSNRFHVRIILLLSRKTNFTKTDIPSENTSGYDAPNTILAGQTPQNKNPNQPPRVESQMHGNSKKLLK